jgi:hypothetical protein
MLSVTPGAILIHLVSRYLQVKAVYEQLNNIGRCFYGFSAFFMQNLMGKYYGWGLE